MGPGFFGKLRSHGDFVARRLPLEMQQPFDAWLQAGIVRSKADLGDAWLPAYLNGPLWRFVLAPGVCGPQAWAGVMMPSADRVGRCFPLILATGLDGAPSLRDCLTVYAAWFVRLEELALSSLNDGFLLEEFDAELQALKRGPVPAYPAASTEPTGLHVNVVTNGVVSTLAGIAIDANNAWWTDGSPLIAPCLATSQRLPPATSFAAFFNGNWQEHGWSLTLLE